MWYWIVSCFLQTVFFVLCRIGLYRNWCKLFFVLCGIGWYLVWFRLIFFVLCGIGQYLVWYKLFFFFYVIQDWMVSSLVQAIFLYVNCEGCLVQAGLLVMYVSIIFLPQNYKLRSLKIMPFPNLCVDFPRSVFLYNLDYSNRWQHLRWNSP